VPAATTLRPNLASPSTRASANAGASATRSHVRPSAEVQKIARGASRSRPQHRLGAVEPDHSPDAAIDDLARDESGARCNVEHERPARPDPGHEESAPPRVLAE